MADIKSVLNNIEKRFGKEAVAGKQEGIEFLSTGVLGLDKALGGGWAKGRIVELYGWESSGKSTIALHTAAECQKEGKIVAYIDAEHAFDPNYASNLGIDISEESGLWYLSQPNNGEEGIEIAREFASCEEVGLVIIDSNTAMVPKAVIQGEAGEQKMGLQARMFSQYIPTLVSPIKRSKCIVLFIGQLREKIGVMFGNPETTTGGNALKFYASQRVKISRKGQTKEGEVVTANGAKCKVEKNKVAPPFKICEFNIEFGTGVDTLGDIINTAIELGIITKKGAGWMNYGDIKLGQGDKAVKQVLEDNPELLEEITAKILES